MVGKRDATPRGDMPADELFEDDGVDSRTAFSRITRRDSGDDRKARQAARVARRAIEFALANECGDARLAELRVAAVEPARGATVLRVVVTRAMDESRESDESIVEQLRAVSGFLRARVARELQRRKAPELTFVVVRAMGRDA